MSQSYLQLQRTFSVANEMSDDAVDYDYETYQAFRNLSNEHRTWEDLLEHQIVVVLGESGIGKTTEFRDRAHRLTQEGQAAFFVPLNAALDKALLNDLLAESPSNLETWLTSNEQGYFFLDAVDEARLQAHKDLDSALRNIVRQVRPGLRRARFILSSRITDWYTPGVKGIVQQVICDTIQRQIEGSKEIRPAEFTLDPLSPAEARRLAMDFGVGDVDTFWQSVEIGGYEFMASRPLDLKWMTDFWKAYGRFGSLTEMMETSIWQRLHETNPNHERSDWGLPPASLLNGAELLAVVCTLSGRPFIATAGSGGAAGASTNWVIATEMLADWRPGAVDTLLSTAVFDEASYGRVRFHHRSVREYLTASWLRQHMVRGLPFEIVKRLFIQDLYGYPVCVRSRRSVLGWLASMRPEVREFVIRECPEILFQAGDAEAWSGEDVAAALERYFHRVRHGAVSGWPNDPGVFGRIGRRAGPDIISRLLQENTDSPEALPLLLVIVRTAGLTGCADAVYRLYADGGMPREVREIALAAFADVANPEQLEAMHQDFLKSRLDSNRIRATACAALFPKYLTPEELVDILGTADPESSHLKGTLTRCVKEELLPLCSSPTAISILRGLLAFLEGADNVATEETQAVPTHNVAPRGGEQSWLATLLPEVFLAALPSEDDEPPEVFRRATVYMERIRYQGMLDPDAIDRAAEALANKTRYRRALALTIAEADPQSGPYRVAGARPNAIARLSSNDLSWVEELAADSNAPECRRQVAFSLLMAITIFCRPPERRAILRAAIRSCDTEARSETWFQDVSSRRQASRWQREIHASDVVRRTEKQRKSADARRLLEERLEAVRSGIDSGALEFVVVDRMLNHSSSGKLGSTNLGVVADEFGPEVAEAVATGLKQFWRLVEPPWPRDGKPNAIPNVVIAGLSGIALEVAAGFEVHSASPLEIHRLARYALWENGAPHWFEELANAFPQDVADAIWPAIEMDLSVTFGDDYYAKGVNILVQGPTVLKSRVAPRMRESLEKQANQGALWPHLRTVLEILFSERVIDADYLGSKIQPILQSAAQGNQWEQVGGWLSFWLKFDPMKAWASFEALWRLFGSQSEDAAVGVGGGLHSENPWPFMPAFLHYKLIAPTEESVSLLAHMFDFFESHILRGNDLQRASGVAYTPGVREFAQGIRDGIPHRIRAIPGAAAHDALARLTTKYRGTPLGRSLHTLMEEHDLDDAEKAATLLPQDIPALGDIYCREPHSEADLFQLALDRLETIRQGVEGGPYSERELFFEGMEERKLQIWLAARLLDTPGRRFGVSREDEVDEQKEPDIHLHHRVGKICIEIKPLDARRYTANALIEALRGQLVGQYLGGLNSRHGILVLFLLKERAWRLHGKGRASYPELLEFMENKAKEILADTPAIENLKIFGINCTGHHL
ncbi:hypothetical protein A4H96_03380 [Acidithiobacillus ferrooxidans]|jgi:hypothetical protein|uniref:Uncharacterized protein n=2 Tax=Acidithiobacillus TaxID=119977 RepID=A0A179BM24_ACIFR|nr:hypothetical protein A4H96_03380 [Acidithiobacillus ferrooxidans]